MKKICWLILLIVSPLVLFGCAVTPISDRSSPSRVELTPQQETSLGTRAYGQVFQSLGGLYPDQKLASYVSAIGQKLVRHSPWPRLNYRFSIVNDSAPNTLALPGGFVVITRGRLAELTSEAELAAVLAREISHIAKHHSLQALQSHLSSTERGLVDVLTLDDAGYSGRILQTRTLTEAFLDIRYSKEQELEAGRLSVDMMTRAGYVTQRLPRSDEERFSVNTESLSETLEAYQIYDEANAVERDGSVGAALELYHKAMQNAPDHGLLLTALGMAYLRTEDLVPARRYLLKAVRADSDYYRSHLGLGYIYLANRQADQALKHFQLSVTLLPTVEGVFLLAEAQALKEQFGRARELYQSVIEIDGNGRLGRTAVERLKMLAQ